MANEVRSNAQYSSIFDDGCKIAARERKGHLIDRFGLTVEDYEKLEPQFAKYTRKYSGASSDHA